MTAVPKPVTAVRSSRRWISWRGKQRVVAMSRALRWCEAPQCKHKASEAHHTFGRRHLVAEPLASHATLLAALCPDHHREATLEPQGELQRHLQEMALRRAQREWPGLSFSSVSLVGRARELERLLRRGEEWQRLCEAAGR